MPPRKRPEHLKLESSTTKIGEPVPKAVIDTITESVGVPPQPDHDPAAELGALRKQVETLRQQVSDATRATRGGARQAVRQTEAAVKLYPVSTLVTVATVAAGFAFAIAGLRSAPPLSGLEGGLYLTRYLYGGVRDRF
jgi:HAMP domain-containing protein